MSEPSARSGSREARDVDRQTSSADRPPGPATEDVLIRNHDFQWGYDLEVAAVGADGRTVHDERYYLQPGGTRSEFGVFGRGVYEVRVVLDGRRTARARVEIDDGADGVLVELGNGTASVHAGLYG